MLNITLFISQERARKQQYFSRLEKASSKYQKHSKLYSKLIHSKHKVLCTYACMHVLIHIYTHTHLFKYRCSYFNYLYLPYHSFQFWVSEVIRPELTLKYPTIATDQIKNLHTYTVTAQSLLLWPLNSTKISRFQRECTKNPPWKCLGFYHCNILVFTKN